MTESFWAITPKKLAQSAATLERLRGARALELVKNQVGNLAIMERDSMVGWLDLRCGEIHLDGCCYDIDGEEIAL